MEQNVVFALLLGLMALYAAKALAARPLPCALAVLALMLLAMAAQVSYGWLGVALCLAYAYAGDSKKRQALFTVLLTLLYAFTLLLSGVARTWVAVSLCAALSVIPIVLYNGRPGPRQSADVFLLCGISPALVRAGADSSHADHSALLLGVIRFQFKSHTKIRQTAICRIFI